MIFYTLELQDFVISVTGSMTTKRSRILISLNSDPHGMICLHTCSCEITLPFGAFKKYQMFKSAMDTVMSENNKLNYNTI